MENKIRYTMNILGHMHKDRTYLTASSLMIKFLGANKRLEDLKQ